MTRSGAVPSTFGWSRGGERLVPVGGCYSGHDVARISGDLVARSAHRFRMAAWHIERT